MKKYIIFAGVNGAGKTTLYQTNDELYNMPRINIDEIVRGFGSWNNPADVISAGKIAVNRIREYFESGISFNQETTLCGQSILNNIERAIDLGYEIEMYYVGLDSIELAKQRVEQRVRDGGHGIPDEDIERRYFESKKNLKQMISVCDSVRIYDNSKSFRFVAEFRKGECIVRTEDTPDWCSELFS